jgi:hypothetical protein
VTDFSKHEDELFMQLLKRRAYMLAFPGELLPTADDIVMDVLYKDDSCCGHDELQMWIGKLSSGKGVMLDHGSMSEFLREFFGVANA